MNVSHISVPSVPFKDVMDTLSSDSLCRIASRSSFITVGSRLAARSNSFKLELCSRAIHKEWLLFIPFRHDGC